MSLSDQNSPLKRRKPEWLKTRLPAGDSLFRIKKDLQQRKLSTICQSARCPNINECWNGGHATFLILGRVCSRDCGFCSVSSGSPQPLDRDEGEKILEMVRIMKLKYVVITSVTRDDLADGGAVHFAEIVRFIKGKQSDLKVEVLIPDFKGDPSSLGFLLDSGPDVVGHNLETVSRLYPSVNRSLGRYHLSLEVLNHIHSAGQLSKSGIMVGLGERRAEIETSMIDLRRVGVDLLTIGQYLQPHANCVPVEKYYHPEEFKMLQELASGLGFKDVRSGPFVRSSYGAREMYAGISD